MSPNELVEKIERTHILFENNSALAKHLGLNQNYFSNRNTLLRNRSQDKIDTNAASLCQYAYSISRNIIEVNNEHLLIKIIDEYYSATISGQFATPHNDRHKRYVENRTLYNHIRNDSDKLVDLVYKCITDKADKKYTSLYRALMIDLKQPHTIYRNYYAAIGILMFLKVIPFCDEKTRIKKKHWDLNADTERVRDFIRKLSDKNRGLQNEVDKLFTGYKRIHAEHWCRYLLILCFSRILDAVIEYVNPDLVKQYEDRLYTRYSIIPENRYWRDRKRHWIHYILEKADSQYYDFYLYHIEYKSKSVKNGEIKPSVLVKRRYNFRYGDSHTEISEIDDFYKVITLNISDAYHVRITSLDESHIEIYGEDPYNPEFDLIPMEEKEIIETEEVDFKANTIKLINEEKAIENLRIDARLNAIMIKEMGFKLFDASKQQMIFVLANHENKLIETFDRVTVKDTIDIYHIEGRRYLVTTIKGVTNSFDITEDPLKYGIIYMN